MTKHYSINSIERLKKLHRSIKEEATGDPKELAQYLHISVRSLYFMLEYLKEQGALIHFSRKDKSYCYLNDFDFSIKLVITVCKNGEMRKITGGYSFTARKLHATGLTLNL